MSPLRTTAIVAGAAALVCSLSAPWYAIDFGSATRAAIRSQTDRLPGAMGEFARELLSAMPAHIEVTGWQAFDTADILLVACAVVALIAALVNRMDVAGFAGVGAAVTAALQLVVRPGPSELVSLRWGAWLALAAALAIVGASRLRSERRVAATPPPPDWTRPTAASKDPEESFAPF